MAQTAIRCSMFRGGTSRGLYFHADDLPSDPETRDAVLVAALGSPGPLQVDGVGGGHPLTSKVAIVSPARTVDDDVDYLFLQVWPERIEVSDDQNCGNLLAAVGPFAVEEGLVPAREDSTSVRIWMQNTGSRAVARVQTPDGHVRYDGDTRMDGVPGTHAPVHIEFVGVAGATCGRLLPTGNVMDKVGGIRVTCIDNGMPVVCARAKDLGVDSGASPAELDADGDLRARVEAIRLEAGALMGLGDVTAKTVPKVSLLSPPRNGGLVSTRTFIPHRVHESIGVFGAVSVATACLLPGSVAGDVSAPQTVGRDGEFAIEHPSGALTVSMDVSADGPRPGVNRAAIVRTARLLMRGEVFVPSSVWRR